MEIPAKYTINAYLREQAKLVGPLTEFLCAEMPLRWHRHRSGKFPKGMGLNELGVYFGTRIRELGAFSVHETYTAGTRNLPHRERYGVNGYFVEPFTLGHVKDATLTDHYAEDAILLRTVNCTLKSKKASNGFGFSGFALPRHVLERIYERTEISREAFPDLIASELGDMLKGLAVARECGIAVADLNGSSPHWVTAVPFANGLIIIKMKFVMGGLKDYDLGFRFEMPSGNIIEPYTSPRRIMAEELESIDNGVDDIALLDCAVTYFNLTTLSEAQASYYYKYQQMKIDIGDALLSDIARYIYEPRLPHEPFKVLSLSEKAQRHAKQLQTMIRSGWIKPKDEFPISAILPFGARPLR